jgi:hypothetical protein
MNQRNFVAPLPVDERRQAANIDVSPYMGGDVIHVGQPLAANHGATEKTNGMDRSKALVFRLLPFSVTWLVLTVGVVWLSGIHGAWGLLIFAGLTALSYGNMDKREYTYSRNGVEMRKVNTLHDLKAMELEQAHELRKMVLIAQIEMARGGQYAITDEGRGDYEGRTITTTHRRIESRD